MNPDKNPYKKQLYTVTWEQQWPTVLFFGPESIQDALVETVLEFDNKYIEANAVIDYIRKM